MKRAAVEAKVWGVKSLKELTPREHNHIKSRVSISCL